MNTLAEAFRRLHAGPGVLILANGWDAASARIIETLGAPAVATSSAAVAWSHGYADGHHLPVDLLIATIADIARVVAIPLTADIEGGYADDAAGVAETVARVIDAGAVGINIEDGAGTPEQLCAKIAAARVAAERAGVPLFINARADVYLRGQAQGPAAVAEVLHRAALYRDAGADGLFAPGVVEADEIATLAREAGLPLNVMARPGLPDAAALQRLGVRRLSSATGPARAALAAMKAAVEGYLKTGDSDALARAGGAPFDYNGLFR